MNQAALKKTLKVALAETIQENRALFADLFAEVLEDMAMATSIREGEKSKLFSRDRIMKVLRSRVPQLQV